MKRRKVIIAVIVATVGLGVAALPAAAELHSVTVVLVTGQRITKTVDIAPGTPASQIVVPGITGAIAQIIDNGPIAVPTPTGTPLPVPTVPAVPTVPGTKPKPKATPTPDGNDKPGAPNRSQGGSGQAGSGQPAGNKKFKAGNLNSKKLVSELKRQAKKKAADKVPGRAIDGTPTLDNPTFSLAQPGAAPIGVPNFFIDKFRIPPFLLPLYQAAGIEYGVRWEVLAAINEIETDYGRNLNVSSAGALGLDAVHARDVEAVRRRRQQGRPEGSRTTRPTRSSPPPATSRRPAPSRTCARRSSPTTTPTGTSTRSSCARA